MSIIDSVREKREKVLERWLELTLKTYSEEAEQFYKNRKNQFANPVGATFKKSLELMLEGVLNNDPNLVEASMEDTVKLRAVQEFSPSQAISFILFLKEAVRDVVLGKQVSSEELADLLSFEGRIDHLLLISMDSYMTWKQKMLEIRMKELQRRTFGLMKHSRLFVEQPEPENESETDN